MQPADVGDGEIWLASVEIQLQGNMSHCCAHWQPIYIMLLILYNTVSNTSPFYFWITPTHWPWDLACNINAFSFNGHFSRWTWVSRLPP